MGTIWTVAIVIVGVRLLLIGLGAITPRPAQLIEELAARALRQPLERQAH